MSVYNSSEQLYSTIKTLEDRLLAENPQAGDSMIHAKLSVQIRCTEPTAVLFIDGKKRPLTITYGSTPSKPTLDIEASSDTLHLILLGELPLMKAIGSKKLRIKGPIFKAKALADLFYHMQKLYPQLSPES